MVWNHFKTAIRILRKQKLTAAINVIGLGIGLSFFALLVAYVRDDLTFDRFHDKAERIYILTSEFRDSFLGGSHHFIADMLEYEFPEVKPGSTLRYAMHSQIVRRDDRLVLTDFAFSDPGFFDMFSFDLKAGNTSRALSEPHQVVLTADTALSFFGAENPMGQTLSIRIGDTFRDFTVSGIVEEIPGNSSLRFDGIIPFSQVFDAYQIDKDNTDFVTLPLFATTLVELPDEAAADALRAKLPPFNRKLYGPMWERVRMEIPKQGFDLLKLSDYHRGDVVVGAFVSPGNPSFSLVLSGIAFLILLLACVNSVNLSLAQSSARVKEVGVRRVIGALRKQLAGQFMAESLLASLASLAVGLTAATLLIGPFNALTGKRLAEKILFQPQTLAVILAAVLFVCLFTGLAPALSLFRLHVSEVFQGGYFRGRRSRFSRFLIVFQFAVSLVFIIGTLVITRQLRFMSSMDLGYDPSNIIVVRTQVPGERGAEGASLLEIFRTELSGESGVLAVTADSGTVGDRYGSITRRYEKNGREHIVETFLTDNDFMKTIGVPLVLGRDFSPDRPFDVQEGILVNEAFVKDFGLMDPVGRRFSDFAEDKLPAEYTFDPVIIGVVRDFHVFSLHVPIGPMGFCPRGFVPIQRYRNILVKVREGGGAAVLKRLETIWAGIRPDLPFSYSYLEDDLAWEYRRERDWGRIVGWSMGFALAIACMGLFGLTAVMAVRRTKETGIRKVLGAGAVDVVFLFTKDVLRWVLAANIIAWPVAWIAARRWLEQFAYRIDISPWIFLMAALISVLVGVLTVSWHAFRASLTDPVQALRHE
jgi:putative ABC transport system permease protein